MDSKHLIIGILIIIVVLLCGGIAYTMLGEHTEYVTETIPESATTLEMPKDMTVKSTNNDSGTIVLENKNTIIILFNSKDKGVAQIMGFANIKNPIFGNEFNGNTTLNDPTVAGCSLEGQCNAVFISNNETHDNIIVISKDKNIVSHIINSIKWGNKTSDNTNASTASTESSASSNNDATYPFRAEDGSILGYYHVGDTVTYKDIILQLQPNGEWVQIGEVTGSAQQGYESGYNSAVEDMRNNDIEPGQSSEVSSDSSQHSSSGSSSDVSSNVETTTDDSVY